MSVRHASRLQENAVLTPREPPGVLSLLGTSLDRHMAVLIPCRSVVHLQAFATHPIPRAFMVTLSEQGARKVMMAGRS